MNDGGRALLRLDTTSPRTGFFRLSYSPDMICTYVACLLSTPHHHGWRLVSRRVYAGR